MTHRFRLFLATALLGSLCAIGVGSSPVSALSYPGVFQDLPDCSSDDQEFCVERLEYGATVGTMSRVQPAVVSPIDYYSGTNPNVSVFFQSPYSGPSSVSAMNPSFLNFNFHKGADSMHIYPPNGTTINGLTDGAYRIVVRLGDFDPSFLLLQGRFLAYSVSRDGEGHFRVDMTARPTPLAMVLGESENSRIAIDRCEANFWVTDCEANLASRGEIFGSFMMNGMAEYRDMTRGMWVAGNASMLQLSPMGLLTGSIDATAKGPHYVPSDFGIEGLVKEGDRYLNPAHFEMGMPLSMIASILSTKMGQTITVEMVKAYLANPASMLSGTVEEVPAGASAAIERAQTLTTTVEGETLRVNFNLTHYSAPNPTLTIKAPATTAPVTPGTPAVAKKKLANGATLSVLKKTSKGKTLTSKALLSPSKGATVTKLVSKSPAVCKVTGTKVRTLKKGSCKISVTVKLKNKSSTTSVAVTVT